MKKKCKQCGNSYEGKGTKFCSPLCSQLAQRKIVIQKDTKVTENYLKSAHEYYNHLLEFGKEIKPIKRKDISHNTKHETLLGIISDTHFGKEVMDILGRASYNTPIAKKKMLAYAAKLVGLTDKVIIKHEINEVVLALAGDHVEGDSAYETIKSHIDLEPAYQTDAFIRCLWLLLISLHKLLPEAHIRVLTAPGNHGMVSKHTSEVNNWDNVVYLQLQHLLDVTKTNWASIETTTQDILVSVIKGHKVMMIHKLNKNLESKAGRATILGYIDTHQPELIITAHWHHAFMNEITDRCLVICNPSLVGGDTLSGRLGLSAQARQWVLGITKKRIPTFMYLMDLKEV